MTSESMTDLSIEYDFYSRWTHDIRVDKGLFPCRARSTCIAGVGAYPLEESGPSGYFMQQLDEYSVVGTLEWLQRVSQQRHPDG